MPLSKQVLIYRKTTATDHTMLRFKMAAYNSLVRCHETISIDSEKYDNEVSIIKYIAVANGCKSDIVDKFVQKQQRKKNGSLVSKITKK